MKNKNICYNIYEENGVICNKKSCKNWIQSNENLNCIILAAKNGNQTLSDIGKMFGLTRMRICQIEKSICKKIKVGFEV